MCDSIGSQANRCCCQPCVAYSMRSQKSDDPVSRAKPVQCTACTLTSNPHPPPRNFFLKGLGLEAVVPVHHDGPPKHGWVALVIDGVWPYEIPKRRDHTAQPLCVLWSAPAFQNALQRVAQMTSADRRVQCNVGKTTGEGDEHSRQPNNGRAAPELPQAFSRPITLRRASCRTRQDPTPL